MPLPKPKKKPSLAKLKKHAWDAFSVYVRLRDAKATTGTLDELLCVTCTRRVPAFGQGCAQAGHFIPGRGNAYLFDEVQTNGQCFSCNIWDHGRWPDYYEVMVKRHGLEIVEKMLQARHDAVKLTAADFLELTAKYKALTAELQPN